jgi:hypothetical protein
MVLRHFFPRQLNVMDCIACPLWPRRIFIFPNLGVRCARFPKLRILPFSCRGHSDKLRKQKSCGIIVQKEFQSQEKVSRIMASFANSDSWILYSFFFFLKVGWGDFVPTMTNSILTNPAKGGISFDLALSA